MLGNMADLFGKVQDMQKKMAEMKTELAGKIFTGEAGGGMVKVTVNGVKEVKSVEIDKDLVDVKDLELLQDVIVAATNKALNEVENYSKNSMGDFAKGMVPGFDLSNLGM